MAISRNADVAACMVRKLTVASHCYAGSVQSVRVNANAVTARP
jgi:hypothetical protein